jgi:Flp pilus assembly protein TadG
MDKPLRSLRLSGVQRGAAAIEFAFILPLLLVIFSGMVEFGRAMWHYDALAKSARDAVRYLSTVPTADLGGEAASATSVTRSIVANAAIRASVAGLTPATDITITCAPTACGSAVSPTDVTTVSVAIDYPFVIGSWVPLFGPRPGDATSAVATTLSPHVTMRYMR